MTSVSEKAQSGSSNRLRDYCVRVGWSFTDLAARLGVDPRSARRYCLPRDHVDFRQPAGVAAERLPVATDGEVHIGHLIPLPERSKRRRSRNVSLPVEKVNTSTKFKGMTGEGTA